MHFGESALLAPGGRGKARNSSVLVPDTKMKRTKGEGDDAKSKKLLRWLPDAKEDEFIYDLQKAPVGHLPLTSTLRGTQLLVNLLDSEVWEWDEFKQD